MKNYLIIFVTALLLSSCATKSSFNSFYTENSADCDFSISTSAFFGNLFIPKDEVKEYSNLFKKVKHYKVMISSKEATGLDKKFDRFISRKNYNTLLKINSKGDQVQLYFLEENQIIKEVILKVKSDSDLVLLGLKTNITEKDFSKIVEDSDLKLTGI